MVKLNAPQLLNILPPAHNHTIRVIGIMSPAVGWEDFDKFQVIIKNINGDVLASHLINKLNNYNDTTNFDFNITGPWLQSVLESGQFYKIQLAYVQEESEDEVVSTLVGYYSNVSIFKYTSTPELTVSAVASTPDSNYQAYAYQLQYTYNSDDSTEKLKSVYAKVYCVLDNENIFLYQTDTQLHSANEDSGIIALPFAFDLGYEYRVKIYGTTINGLDTIAYYTNGLETVAYYPLDIFTNIDPISETSIDFHQNKDIGGAIIQITNNSQTSGNIYYKLWKKQNHEFSPWGLVATFSLPASGSKKFLDYVFEQGEEYQYQLQKFDNDGEIIEATVYPQVPTVLDPSVTEPGYLTVDFEDLFLYDGQRQLKIKFDPKVSSFKYHTQENKFEPIGSQYPNFSRGDTLHYAELPLSGLISYHMDDMFTFLTDDELEELGLNYEINYHTNLTANNIKAERKFKMQILEWLNNGQPKLLKSPTEGNFLIYTMDASLSPVDTVGRMLHSFSCSAYEMDQISLDTLTKYDLLTAPLNPAILDDKHSHSLFLQDADIYPKTLVVTDNYTTIPTSSEYDRISVQIGNDALRRFLANETMTLSNIPTLSPYACYHKETLQKVSGTFIEIPSYAFYYCRNLQNLITETPITNIATYGLYQCSNLETIDLTAVTSLGTRALMGCQSLPHLDLLEVTTIGTYACAELRDVEHVNLPKVTTMVGTYTFKELGYNTDDGVAFLLTKFDVCGSNCFRDAYINIMVLTQPTSLTAELKQKIQTSNLSGDIVLYLPGNISNEIFNSYKSSDMPWGTENVYRITTDNVGELRAKGLIISNDLIANI